MPISLLLHGRHSEVPPTYESFGPWIVPWRFTTFDAEHDALRTAVGLLDYSCQALLEVRGIDRVGFLQRLLSNDVSRLMPGAGCRAALLTANAKLIADLVVLCEAEALWLMCEATRAEPVAQTLERYRFSEQVTIINHERRDAVFALQGPRTWELLHRLWHLETPPSFPESHISTRVGEAAIRVVRHALTPSGGALTIVEASRARGVWQDVLHRGAGVGVSLAGWEALNAARIEAGLPWFGIDMDDENLLPETGLEAVAASDTKGCYVGQEIVARLSTYGSLNKKLVGLLVEGRTIPQAGDTIVRDEEPLGRITSACRSPALQRPIAMGYVKRGAYEAGTAIEILRGPVRCAATVTALPFVRAV